VPYWPKHIIEQLPGQPAQTKIQRSGLVTLTVRQQEVMDLICRRGLSNKQIAKTLNLSESTVKIHVSAVMRAHGVRNRTQLALTAGAGLQA
jgi:DNA-binding NarL/FixJ family response regulator